MKKSWTFAWKKWWVWVLASLLLLTILGLSALPALVRNGLQSMLLSSGVENVSYQDFEVDIFGRELRFRELRLQTPGAPGLFFHQASVKFSIIPLWGNTLHITEITIQDSQFNAQMDADGTWNIAGLKLPIKTEKRQEQATGWEIHLDAIDLKNTRFDLVTTDTKSSVQVNSAFIEARYKNVSSGEDSKDALAWRYRINAHIKVGLARENLEIATRVTSSGSLPQSMRSSGTASLSAKAEFQEILVRNTALALDLLKASSVKLDDISVASSTIRVKRATMSSASIGDPSKGKEAHAPLIRLEKAQIDTLQWQPGKRLHIDSILLSSAKVNARRLKSGEWETLAKLESKATKKRATRPGTSPGKNIKSMLVRINKIEIDTPSQINIHDQTVTPAVKTRLLLKKGSLEEIDSSLVNNKSPITISGNIGDYGRFDLKGKLLLFAAKVAYSININVNDLDLPPLSPYVTPKTGYEITHGHLDMSSRFQASRGNIEGDNDLTFKKLKIKPVDQQAIDKMTKRLTMPLETVMLMLEDKERIRLKVPISGKEDDPDFSFTDVLNKAVINALRTGSLSYVKYYFQPYGTLVTVIQLGDKVFKMKLDPILFTPGGSTLDQKAKDYLSRVARLMKDKKRLDLSICGRAVPADELTDKDQANALARIRSENVRDYLVKNLKISSKRLYICQPEPDTGAEAQPRVELQF